MDSSYYSVDMDEGASALRTGETTDSGSLTWVSGDVPIDFGKGFRFDAYVKVNPSTRSDTPFTTAGFVMAVTDDRAQGASHVFYVYVADSPQRIILATGDNSGSCVNADGSGVCSDGSQAGFPDVHQYNWYRFVVEGGVGSLYINDQTAPLIWASSGSRNHARDGEVWFGDNNIRTRSKSYVRYFSYANAAHPRPDCNANGVPDECDVSPVLVSAVSVTSNPTAGTCITEADVFGADCHSEPHQVGISEMHFTFDNYATETCLSSVEQATCSAPEFGPYTGAAVANCTSEVNVLICTFTPALENGRTYRFNVTGGSAVIRGLVGDVNDDGFVNALDRSAVIGAWTGSGFSCETDVNSDGVTNALDRSIVIAAWTGSENSAPCPPAACTGSGSFGDGFESPDAGSPDSAEFGSDASGSDYVQSEAVLELRPVGGGPALTELSLGATYEVHYAGALYPVQGYTLLAGGSEGAAVSAGAASRETWSGTGLFETATLPGEPSRCGSSEGLESCYQVLDDLAPGELESDSSGYLCDLTMESAGDLVLELTLYFADEATQTTYLMRGTASVSVAP